MKLAIIAATGGVGQQLLRQALDAGHDVTAVVRNPAKLPADLREARIVTADLAAPHPAALEAAIAGTDAVVSGLGPPKHRRRHRRAAAPAPSSPRCGRRGAADRRDQRRPVATMPRLGARTHRAMIPATGSSCAISA